MKILYRNAIERTLRDYYIGSSKKTGTITFNQELLTERIKLPRDSKKVTELFVENLKTVQRDWQYTLCVLHYDNGDIYYNYESGQVLDTDSVWMNDYISEAMRNFILETEDGNERSWFWVISPHNSMNIEKSIDTLIDVFDKSNLLELPEEEWQRNINYRQGKANV